MQGPERPRALIEARVAELFANQYDHAARWQLLGLGLRKGAIEHRSLNGRFVAVYPGVYALGHGKSGGPGRLMAAVLAGGPGALLSHQSAAHHWEILNTESGFIHVTITKGSRRRFGSIVFHRARELHPRDCTRKRGIPITAIPRTLLDLAECVPPKRLRRAFEQSQRLHLFDQNALNDLIARSHGRHGLKPLTALAACSSLTADSSSPDEPPRRPLRPRAAPARAPRRLRHPAALLQRHRQRP